MGLSPTSPTPLAEPVKLGNSDEPSSATITLVCYPCLTCLAKLVLLRRGLGSRLAAQPLLTPSLPRAARVSQSSLANSSFSTAGRPFNLALVQLVHLAALGSFARDPRRLYLVGRSLCGLGIMFMFALEENWRYIQETGQYWELLQSSTISLSK